MSNEEENEIDAFFEGKLPAWSDNPIDPEVKLYVHRMFKQWIDSKTRQQSCPYEAAFIKFKVYLQILIALTAITSIGRIGDWFYVFLKVMGCI